MSYNRGKNWNKKKTKQKNPTIKDLRKTKNSLNSLIKLVNQVDLDNDKYFYQSEDILYIPYYKSLPPSIVNQIEEHLKKYPIRVGRCFNNSTNLTLNIEGIKTVHGWYSYNILEERDSLLSQGLETEYLDEIIGFIRRYQNEDFFRVNSENGQVSNIVDIKNNLVWLRHSWNSYKGIQFDITREFLNLKEEFYGQKKWMKYKKIREFNQSYYFRQLNKNGKIRLLNNNIYSSLLSGSGDFSNPNENEYHPILNDYMMVS